MYSNIQLGLRLHDTDKTLSFPEKLGMARAQGFTCVHLALSKIPGLCADPAALTPGYAAAIRRAFDKEGLSLAVLGCYLNLGNPDAAEQKNIQERYIAHLRFASYLGMGVVGTETGCPNKTYTPDRESCRSEDALEHFVENLRPVVKSAEKFGTILAIEPVASHIVWNAQRARTVLDSIHSPNLQIILDPVNLLDAENESRADEVFEEAIDLLGKDVCVLHLKDYVPEGNKLRSVGCGKGKMNYDRILRFALTQKPCIQATLENTTPEDAIACRRYLETKIAELRERGLS
ncbi:MAG: sugar phosphate isomerase/epimerase family protein [Lachnospiraceae bacterium]